VALDIRAFSQRLAITAGVAQVIIREARTAGSWTADRILDAIADADAQLGATCEAGVRGYEAGDYWVALHVLVPQVERAVRALGVRLDADVHRVTSAQRLLWANLDPLLADPSIRAALGEDFAVELGWLFTSEFGPNIRNNVAHGAADMANAEFPSTVTLMAILTVADVLASSAIPIEPAPSDAERRLDNEPPR
jgi:hypothetical protein